MCINMYIHIHIPPTNLASLILFIPELANIN